MDGVAKTSLLTAAMRAAETRRTDHEGRLFNDPYAELLAGDEGTSLLQRAIAHSGEQPVIAIRTFFIDEKIKKALKEGVRQIVMLAAGMDTRAYRLSFPEGTRIFEIDRQEVLDYKKDKLGKTPTHCERTAIAVDLREEWQNQLVEAGFKSQEQTLWLVEGLLMYLEESQVMTLMNQINSLSSAKDILIFDILSCSLLDAPFMQSQLEFLASIGAPWKFGTNEPVEMMKKLGWSAQASQAGEVAPTRWPFPVVPLHIPNVPRGFFIEAQK